jgi:hypothetical protein
MGVHRIDVEATKKLQDELDAAREQLAAGAGRALAEWGVVELMLTFLFASIVSRTTKPIHGLVRWENADPQNRLSQAMLNAVVGFDVRVALVTATIAESDLRKDLKALWPEIAKRLTKLYKKRHEVAHFMFDQLSYPDGRVEVLLAPFPKTVTSMDAKRLNRTELDHKAERFNEMGGALHWFMSAVEIQRRRAKGPRAPAPALIQRARQSLKTPS